MKAAHKEIQRFNSNNNNQSKLVKRQLVQIKQKYSNL